METLEAVAPPIIDTHAHIYTMDMPQTGTAWHRPPSDATVQNYLAALDKAGIRFGILAAASTYGDYNDYALEATRTSKRLRTTVIANPDIDPAVLRDMSDSGAVGIRLQFRNVASPPDLSSYEYRRLLKRVADLGWHVHLHDDGHRLPNYINALLAAGPRLVIDHFGRPTPDGGKLPGSFRAILRAVEGGKTWVKLSSGFRLTPPDFANSVIATLLKEAGPERLMWGSDWPFAAFEDSVTYESALSDYYLGVPDPEIRRAIDRTALAFYFS
jgi:predicted TIM-barrel fold metal-dependent hydrolase